MLSTQIQHPEVCELWQHGDKRAVAEVEQTGEVIVAQIQLFVVA